MIENNGEITQARPYQEELLYKAIERNTIVYLPTGTGKTFIAVMLVKELSDLTEKKYSEGGKRSIFLAPNVPLVNQQAEYFRRHTSSKVECYFGEKKIDEKVIDLWDEKIWNRELEHNQLLVMTPKIFYDMIAHSFIDLNRINLLIFDECHRAVGLHDYCQILRICREFDPTGVQIRILGLTACVVQIKCNLSEFNTQFKKLEETFNCKIETILVESDELGIHATALFKKPQIKVFTYKNDEESNLQIVQRLTEVISKLSELEKKYEKYMPEQDNNSIVSKRMSNNIYKYIRKEFKDLLMVLNELGLYCFKEAFKSFKQSLNLKLSLLTIEDNELLVVQKLIDSLKEAFDFLLNHYLPDNEVEEAETIFQKSSVKVRCLMNIYAQRNDCFDKDFHSIIFVEQRKIAYSLSELLKNLSRMDQYSFIKASYVVGTNSSEDSMNQNKQKIELDKFRRREVNVLVATNVIEEGIDVPSCNMVIRFSKPNNFCSFIQSKGRARSNASHYYLIVEEGEVDVFDTELNNFLEIENDIQYKLIKTRNDILDETPDDVEFLNTLIPPLKKGNSELTCMKALELINRWVNTLQRDSCCKLCPFYNFEEIKVEEIKEDKVISYSLYKCILWLPPNPIIVKQIESEKFRRKKWAKMHAALLACKELDNAGQLTSNLILVTENEWIKPHIELDEDIKEKFEKSEKIKKYQITVLDEFKNNHAMANTNLNLYKIGIKESSADLIDDSFQLGFLSAKLINEVPEFILYEKDKELSVKLTHVSSTVILNQDQINLLRKANKSIFNDMLRFNCDFDFESSLYGGLIVILSPNGDFSNSHIDWATMESLKLEKENFNTYSKKYPKNDDVLLRMNANKVTIENSLIKNQTSRLFMLLKVHDDMNPLTHYVNREAKNFKEHFLNKYQLETTDLAQPLIELKHVETSLNHVSKTQLSMSQNKTQPEKIKEIFIGEHFLVLPFEKKYFFAFCLLPAIFHRINSLIKASHLKNLIENFITSSWNIKPKKVESTWNSSLKFNKVKSKQIDITSDSETESEDSLDLILCYRRDQDDKEDESKETTIPDLLIKEHSDQEELEFPSTYSILQCLTLKSARENFDLERYEILGDCFLKLVVVLRIYLKFGSTNEGNMAFLKSLRVSNKYLFKLAQNKNLQNYINSTCFEPRVNWILPNEIVDDKDDRLHMQLNFKSLADSIEALIGCYLMHLGQKGGKECIRWLELKVSNQDDMTDFNEDLPLPNPLLAPKLPDSICLKEYEKFAETINYKFNNLIYLYQAFTHPSYLRNRYTASYQKLELIGDAVLDILVTQYIFADKKEYSPGELTNLRQSLVNNKFFAFLAVKHNFHNYMKYDSPAVYNSINEYAKMHETCPPDFSYLDRKASFESLAQNDMDEYDIETPKFLADIFESVAGAIYLDSNCSLEAVWRVYYPIMKLYLIKFKKNPPVSPIVALNTLKPQVNFKIEYEEEENGEKVAILKGDDKEFSAKAKTKTSAKLKVHKKAVRFYDPERKIIFF